MSVDHPAAAMRVIEPFIALNAQAVQAGVLVLCDHASALIPHDLGDLGLAADQRKAHVVWDIGAAKVSRILSRWLNCPALLSGVSRLVVDCNRFPHDPSAMPEQSCTVPVPGNAGLTPAQRQNRLDRWFHPYHRVIDAQLARMASPLVVSVHSFTPQIPGQPARPWHIGVLWNRDQRLSQSLVTALQADPQLVVGLNQPYSGQDINYTLDRHAGVTGLAHVSVEIRQDLLADEYGCAEWGQRLAQCLAPLALRDDLRQPLAAAERLDQYLF